MGKISRAYGWDEGDVQSFLSINPLGDEVSLYKTQEGSNEEDVHKAGTKKGFNNVSCLAHSPIVPGLVAVGQEDGYIKVFDISQPHSASLEIRSPTGLAEHGALSNSISFNTQGLLATGLGKAKKTGSQQHSLLIYNINHYSKTSNQEMHQPTFSYINNESVYSNVFYNETNLLVGTSKFIRDIDIRVSSPVFQISSKTIHGITQDPFNQFNFAAFSEDGTLSIFDRRKLTNSNPEPSLSFSKLLGDTTRRNNYYCFRYSSVRRGEFGTSHSGELIRRWQIGSVPSNKYDSLFVSRVFDSMTKYDRIISFDYSEQNNGNMNILCMRQSGSVFKMPLIESERNIGFNSFNDLIVTGRRGIWIETVDEVIEKIENININNYSDENDDDIDLFNQFSSNIDNQSTSDEEDNDDEDEDEDDVEKESFYKASEVLENDISVKMRKRAYLGYGTNCLKNLEVINSLKSISNNVFLRSTWKWLEIAHNSSTSGLMTSKDLDLSFEGVLGIWKGVGSLQTQDRFSSNLKEDNFKQQILEILSTRRSKAISIVKSNKEPQRKLCMILAGFYFNSEELEEIYKRLMKNNQYTKAAGWAVFIGDIKRAVKILSSSKNNKLKLIATAISGYLVQKNTSDDNIWKDQCRQMSLELTDPYLKAIFAFIAENDWWAVLEESSLPLRERIGVALRCLSDSDLTNFLNKVSEKYIKRGELEGLILTGITTRGIDLLQGYVDRTSDVQTAAIISSFGCPRYFKDERSDNWIFAYRQLLNSWGMFSLRAKFDVERAKLSRTTAGKLTLKPIGSQIMIQCIRCNKNISKDSETPISKFNSRNSISYNQKFKHSFISSCPHCGSPLPKCAICLLPLGKPIPGDKPIENDHSLKLEEFKQWPSFCLSCNHGMHAGHAEEWFLQSNTCPVPGCYCRCNNR